MPTPPPGPPRRYTFGDSDTAIERLDLLARLFAPGTAALLDRWAGTGVDHAVELAVDLGCGPGHTSELIARRCRPHRLLALDSSPNMVEAAARRLAPYPGARAAVADVTGPLPGGPADLLHARYLLAHLRAPAAAVDAWCDRLRPRGRLLLDEIDHIDVAPSVDPFRRYLDLVTAMLADHGTDLFAGRALAGRPSRGATAAATVRLLGSELVELAPPTGAVARLFALNLAVWRHDPWARAHVPAGELDDLAAALARLAAVPAARDGEIEWTHRQVAYERR